MPFEKITNPQLDNHGQWVISFIVPCKNEASFIEDCIQSILAQSCELFGLELIVVDNGSTDRSIDIINKYKYQIKLLYLPYARISEVRNYGAIGAKGKWLVFVDGDVAISEDWGDNFIKLLKKLKNKGLDNNKLLTGSTCSIPEKATWIERIWFAQALVRDKKNDRYINSGHLIVHRNLFFDVGGFDPHIETGEDEKFCQDAREMGAVIIKEPTLKAVHFDYPKTIARFFGRERWHGKGMKSHLRKPWAYRDLQIALYNWCIFLLLIVLVLVGKINLLMVCTLTLLLFLPLLLLSISRSRKKAQNFIPLTVLYFVYGIAKSIALFDIVSKLATSIQSHGNKSL